MERCMVRATAAAATPARVALRVGRPTPLPRAVSRPLAPRGATWRARRTVAAVGAGADGGEEADDLAAVRALLSSNAEQLAAVPPAVAAAGSPEGGAAQARLARLMDEERRLAALEAQLAGAEQGLSAKERALLEQMLASQRVTTTSSTASQQMRAQLEATEAEAAALRAVITAGRTPAGGILEPMVLERPTVRQVMDWSDVDWAALSMRDRLQTWWDIVIGKTMDEWADEWAIARAEGFGLKGFSTLLLAATVIVCAAYSLLAMTTTAAASGGVIAPAVAALGAKPFALPTSTLLVVVRVILSSVLVIAEQICTFIYYMPAMFVAPVAAAVLWHRQQCKEAGVPPIWARGVAVPKRATKQVVLLKKVPAPLVPPIYYKGVTLPDAIAELAERPGAQWPPKIAAPPKKKVQFTLAEDVDRLLYGGGAAKAPPAPSADLTPGPVRPPPGAVAAGEDWRLLQLQSTLGRAEKGVAATPRSTGAPAAPAPAAAAGADLDGMAAVRARFAAMQTTLKTGADQAADDASQRKF